MPAGGLQQLVNYGGQDIYLTGEPQVTHFKTVYRRSTSFAMEPIHLDPEVIPTLSTTNHSAIRFKIDRNADLVGDMYLVLDLPPIYSTEEEAFTWVEYLGEQIIYSTQIELDGQQLDKQYMQWMHIWYQLTLPPGKKASYEAMIGYTQDMVLPSTYYGAYTPTATPTINSKRLYIPLALWFTSNPGLYLPLIALQYNQMYVNLELTELNRWFTMWYHMSPRQYYEFATAATLPAPTIPTNSVDFDMLSALNTSSLPNTPAQTLLTTLNAGGWGPDTYFWKFVNGTQTPGGWVPNFQLLVNYIYLDEDERKRFAATSHEYLIFQVQQQTFTGQKDAASMDIVFQHPTTELIVAVQRSDVYYTNEWFNYTNCLFRYPSDSEQFSLNIGQYTKSVELETANIPTCLPSFPPVQNATFINHQEKNICYDVQLLINGENRFRPLDFSYFENVQPFRYHTNGALPGIMLYSFSLNPEEHQPAGTANFSRFQRVQLNLSMRNPTDPLIDYTVYVFARNYQVLRIMGGIGSVAFSN